MELKKRAGICTEDVFWKCVSEINWVGKPDTHQAKRACLVAWTPEFGRSFHEILEKKEGEVYRRFSDFSQHDLSSNERNEYYLGDDSYGDLCSHVVGMGRVVFEKEIADPRRIFERARDSNYREKFSYCIPGYANPQTTWAKWLEMYGYPDDESQWEEKWKNSSEFHFSSETFEEHVEKLRRSHVDWQLGDWAYLDPGHYVPLSKRYHGGFSAFVAELSGTESLTEDETCALDFAALLMHYFGALVDGRTRDALEVSEEALRAWWGLHFIAEDQGSLRKAQAELLPMSEGLYGGENTINDHRIYMGGLSGFKCQHHYKLIKKNAAA